MEFKPLSRYWEQTLTIFDDILLERTVHVQLGLKKQCTVKKVSKYVVRIGCEQFLKFSRNQVQVCYNVKRTCIFHLILICIPSILILSIKNRGWGGQGGCFTVASGGCTIVKQWLNAVAVTVVEQRWLKFANERI